MGEGLELSPQKELSYSEIFDLQFPRYLAMGMSAQEFWYGDPNLVIAYRKAKEIKDREHNEFLWLQGRYVYDAICATAPLLNFWSPQNPTPYNEKPYPMSADEARKDKEDTARKHMEEMRSKMDKIMRKEREDAKNG